MSRMFIPIEIPDNEFSNLEQFREIAPGFSIGSEGTVRIGSYGFSDGESICLNLSTLKVRREAGFHKRLKITNNNNEEQSYIYSAGTWFQETQASNQVRAGGFEAAVNHYGFFGGLEHWGEKKIDELESFLLWLTAPLYVVPLFFVRILMFLDELLFVLFIAIVFWGFIFSFLLGLLT